MKAQFGYRAAGVLNRVMTPKSVIGLAKYMYIKAIIDHHKIDLILDVGANTGAFATSMRLVGYTGKIISFEPVSQTFEALKQASAHDTQWEIRNYALGETATAREINVMSSNVFSSFRKPSEHDTEMFKHENKVVGQERVEIRRLADIVEELGVTRQLDRVFLKSDTQGYDMQVLRGAGDYLSSIRMLQMEVPVSRIYEDAPTMTEVLAFVEQHGFQPVAMFPITKLEDWRAAELDYLGVNRNVSANPRSG